MTDKALPVVHGHTFHFIDEPELGKELNLPSKHAVTVTELTDLSLLNDYTLTRPWVPLSGQKGRYFSKTPFEEAEETFSWGLEVKDVLTLLWEAENKTIYYVKAENYSTQRLQFWVYHTFFPMTLELNKFCHFLHVGAVEVKGKTLFFSAPSFGGKSTLADYFIQKDATLISDDALGIVKKGSCYSAIPAYPFHRPYREPEELGYAVDNFATTSKAIDAIFLLQKAEADANINIEEVKGIEKFKALHHSVFIEFPFRKEERFKFFGEMAQTVPVYTVTIPWDLKRLEEVYKTILSMLNNES